MLDVDDSDQVLADEFRKFIKQYEPPKREGATFGGRGGRADAKGLGGTMSALVSQEAVASQPTAEMRSELQEAGVELPTAEEQVHSGGQGGPSPHNPYRDPDPNPNPNPRPQVQLAKTFYEALEKVRSKWGEKTQGAISWHNVFAAFDADGSGFVTFDELYPRSSVSNHGGQPCFTVRFTPLTSPAFEPSCEQSRRRAPQARARRQGALGAVAQGPVVLARP